MIFIGAPQGTAFIDKHAPMRWTYNFQGRMTMDYFALGLYFPGLRQRTCENVFANVSNLRLAAEIRACDLSYTLVFIGSPLL